MRIVACPTRLPGESGRAFVERMLAELNTKGSASYPQDRDHGDNRQGGQRGKARCSSHSSCSCSRR
jgi:hypothetical protein